MLAGAAAPASHLLSSWAAPKEDSTYILSFFVTAQCSIFMAGYQFLKKGGTHMNLFETVLPYVISGVSVGGQYALIAIGYTMVYGILRLHT